MSPKEVEHWLIENGFDYKQDHIFPFWQHKQLSAGVTDSYIQQSPKEAISWVKEQLRNLNASASN